MSTPITHLPSATTDNNTTTDNPPQTLANVNHIQDHHTILLQTIASLLPPSTTPTPIIMKVPSTDDLSTSKNITDTGFQKSSNQTIHFERDKDITDFFAKAPNFNTGTCCMYCMQELDTKQDLCQLMCTCKPVRWVHNKCLYDVLSEGFQVGGDFLAECLECHTNVHSELCCHWYAKALPLMQQRGSLDEANNLMLNVLFRIIRYGGGAKRNILLGNCLNNLGYIMYEHDYQISKHTRRQTVSVRSGHLCWNAVTIFGALPTLIVAQLMCKMVTACTTDLEKKMWCNRAVTMIDMAQKNISDTLQARHVKKHIKADIMRLEVLFCCPPINKNKDLFRKVRQKWWLSAEKLNANQCFIICKKLAQLGGATAMGNFFDHGKSLNYELFQSVSNYREQQKEIDIDKFERRLKSNCSKENIRKEISQWLWGVDTFSDEVIGTIIQAFKGSKPVRKKFIDPNVYEMILEMNKTTPIDNSRSDSG